MIAIRAKCTLYIQHRTKQKSNSTKVIILADSAIQYKIRNIIWYKDKKTRIAKIYEITLVIYQPVASSYTRPEK